ncbi:hypothetical protein QBC43DRAFT_319063 [Cladorrhinum sp. PSN259]|nr:hypothetical protein QBC43DRAFT_319063 [Cladorrhinum sp. PSN259]
MGISGHGSSYNISSSLQDDHVYDNEIITLDLFLDPQSQTQVHFNTPPPADPSEKVLASNNRFTCPECFQDCADTRELHRHMWRNHPKLAKEQGIPSEKEKCPYCGKEMRKDNIGRHQMSRHNKTKARG